MDTNEIRRVNLRRLAARTSWTDLAKRLGYQQPSFLVQMAGPNPTRDVTEKSARIYEGKLGLTDRSLDVLPIDLQPSEMIAKYAINTIATAITSHQQTVPSDDQSGKIVEDVIAMVAAAIAQERVQLDPVKYASLVQLALSDAMEHGGQARRSFVQQVVKLLK